MIFALQRQACNVERFDELVNIIVQSAFVGGFEGLRRSCQQALKLGAKVWMLVEKKRLGKLGFGEPARCFCITSCCKIQQ